MLLELTRRKSLNSNTVELMDAVKSPKQVGIVDLMQKNMLRQLMRSCFNYTINIDTIV